MSTITPEINILTEEQFTPSTMTIKGILSESININNLSQYLFIHHIFDETNQRVKKASGSRRKIDYYGREGDIVSVCYKNIRRGMRAGAMNNMVTVDIQYLGNNIHLKISSNTITSVGTSKIDSGKRVVNKIIEKIKELQSYLTYSNCMDKEIKEKNILWLKNTLSDIPKETRLGDLKGLINVPKDMDEKLIFFLINYWDDFDDIKEYFDKLDNFKEVINVQEDEIECRKYDIFNSVYHLQPILNRSFRMPLHKLSPFLAQMGAQVEYHNWTSEGVNVCFDIEEKKEGFNHAEKDYKHRFTIHETTKIRQCSPTSKKEAYRNYLGMMNILKRFFAQKDVDYSSYISEEVSLAEASAFKKK